MGEIRDGDILGGKVLCWKCEKEIKYVDDVSIDPLTRRVYCPTCIEFIKELVCPVCHQRSFIWAFKVINGQRICLTCVAKRKKEYMRSMSIRTNPGDIRHN